MKVELHEITIRELVDGYMNNESEGVVGYGGRLNIRPKYQREFVYKEKQRNAVIDTVVKHFPLNVMYWAVCDDGTYEVIDGQQRTISICEYVAGAPGFSVGNKYFHNLQSDEQESILDYRLMVYWCSGSDSEKLKWFETINIAGERLTDQELRNAVYSGEWVSDAKRYFSKNGCVAQEMASDYLKGAAIRQEYLETAIRWHSDGNINEYMAQHQHECNANALWLYFQQVINWVKVIFPCVRKEMKGVEWGELYNRHHCEAFDSVALESHIVQLMQDEDVTNKRGIYAYLLGEGERNLSIRAFSDKMKREAYERQGGMCPLCGKHFEIEEMEGDHITPWSQGGATTSENCQMLCRDCNRRKSDH